MPVAINEIQMMKDVPVEPNETFRKGPVVLHPIGLLGAEVLTGFVRDVYGPAIDSTTAALYCVHLDVEKSIAEIKQDQTLSPIGRSKKLQEAVASAEKLLEKTVEDRSKFFNQALAREQKNILPEPPPLARDDLAGLLHAQEIRARLGAIANAKDRLAVARAAAAAGNSKVVRALIDCPLADTVPLHSLDGIKRAWRGAVFKDATDHIESLEQLKSQIRSNAATVRAGLRKL
jgi:hypothetical protein